MSKEQEEPKSELKKGEYVISSKSLDLNQLEDFLKKFVMTPNEIRKQRGM